MLSIKVHVLLEKSDGYSTCDWWKEMEIFLYDEDISKLANALMAIGMHGTIESRPTKHAPDLGESSAEKKFNSFHGFGDDE